MKTTGDQSHPHSMRAYVPAWLVLLAGFAASAGAAAWFWKEAAHLDKARFDSAVTNLIERLDTCTERYAEQMERFTDWIT